MCIGHVLADVRFAYLGQFGADGVLDQRTVRRMSLCRASYIGRNPMVKI